jgi:hypothetical protein
MKLTSTIVNILHINRVIIRPNKYSIYIANNNIDGIFFLAFGHIYSRDDRIDICQFKNPADYKTVTNWVENLGHCNST